MKNNNNNTVEKLSKKLKLYKTFIWILSPILVILIILVLRHLILYGTHIKVKSYPLLDPARAYLTPESYVINIQKLRAYLHGLEDQYGENISIYYEQINSGSNISVNKDVRLFPASLSKLVQAILITKKVEDGIWTWDKKLETKPEDISSDSGELYKTIGNQSLTVEELLKELLENSDNTAQNIFRHYLDIPDYISFQETTGLEDLYNEQGFISAKEYTRILRVLYTSSFLEPKYSEKILEYLSQAKFKDYLSQGIPSDIKFAHKYGENVQYNIFADSGIVYVPGKPYMLTVMIKGEDATLATREKVVKLMKEISEQAYETSK